MGITNWENWEGGEPGRDYPEEFVPECQQFPPEYARGLAVLEEENAVVEQRCAANAAIRRSMEPWGNPDRRHVHKRRTADRTVKPEGFPLPSRSRKAVVWAKRYGHYIPPQGM